MMISTKSGSVYQLVRLENRSFQLRIGDEDRDCWVNVGKTHRTFMEALDELLGCELEAEEIESLDALKWAVKEITNQVQDWFQQHNDYLATL
ncbi:hypothetical protein A4G18_07325 [Pasteurellaceae bacterium Pebbles2]|nr:hypothetical protein [Pasteurellaceae bacterium Pebbles2]